MRNFKQYDIYPKRPANLDWLAYDRDIATLREQVLELAKKHGEAVYALKVSDTPHNSELGGMTGVMIECSELFLDKVRALPLFGEAHIGSGYDLERSRLISPPRNVEQYRILPEFNRQALRRDGMTQRQFLDAVIHKEKTILDSIRDNVKNIVGLHGGTVSNDAADFGVEGKSGQFGNFIVFQMPKIAVDALKTLPETKIEKFTSSTFTLPKTL